MGKADLPEGASILVVDDDALRLARALRDRGYEVQTAAGFDAAIAHCARDSPEYAVVDLRMPGHSGMELVQELKRIDPATKVVVLTGYGSIATAIEAIRLGATYYVHKPADADDVLAAFARGDAAPLDPAPVEYRAPSLARAEWEHISRVLSDCGGNVSAAARRLGIHRRSLQRSCRSIRLRHSRSRLRQPTKSRPLSLPKTHFGSCAEQNAALTEDVDSRIDGDERSMACVSQCVHVRRAVRDTARCQGEG